MTCVNPEISFKQKTADQGEQRFQGVAVALSPFLAMLANHGLQDVPPPDRIKQDINNHGLGVTKKAKQVFNVRDDGSSISRCKDAVPTHCKYCVFVKRSGFSPEAWEEFAKCNVHYLL